MGGVERGQALRHSPRQIDKPGGNMSPRISYVQPSTVTDEKMLAEFDRCAREGTPRPEALRCARMCRGYSGRSRIPGATSFRRAWAITRSRNCAASTSRARCLRVLRQPALDKAFKAGIVEDDYLDLFNFETRPIQRQREGSACLCGGDHLGPARDRRAVGATGHAFQRARTGRARLLRGAHHGPAALAAPVEHRAPSGNRRHRRLDGARLRERGRAEAKAQADYWAKKPAQPQTQAAE